MTTLALRHIRLSESGALESLLELRRRLGAQGQVVSKRGRELTLAAFGEALTPVQVVERICGDVRLRGVSAVLDYTARLDRVSIDVQSLRVGPQELAQAHANAAPDYLETLRRVRQNVMAFQLGILQRDATFAVGDRELRLRYRPIERVGVCVPGGAAAYPSTLLMTVCPARAAGVKEIAVVLPPTPNGGFNADVLAACHELGVTEVYRVGGAQAVAALAYGVDGIPAVQIIVGPGNLFVSLAKRYVFGDVGIDMLAGPSEVVVVADETAPPAYVAADLIAQAEHSPGASLLITWHEPLIAKVADEIARRLELLPRGALARESLEEYGALLLAASPDEAMDLVNQIAPEHLHLAVREPEKLIDRVESAGAVFLGHETPVALGDYVAGPSHVLPTGGTARFASGLSANDFLRRTSIVRFSHQALKEVAGDVRLLAQKEGLLGHSDSVYIRLTQPIVAADSLLGGPTQQPASFVS